jgi:hypothetical protein
MMPWLSNNVLNPHHRFGATSYPDSTTKKKQAELLK